MSNSSALRRSNSQQQLALAAVIGSVLFTVIWFILGFISKGYTMWDIEVTSYSAISQPISGLGMGDTAPYMNAAFIGFGVLLILGVYGIFRAIPAMKARKHRIYTALLMLPGIGSIMDGIFNLEAMLLHSLGFLLVISPIISFPLLGFALRRVPTWRRLGGWLIAAGPVTLLLSVLYFATFDPTNAGANTGIAGLTERILVIQILFWYVVMGLKAFRQRQ